MARPKVSTPALKSHICGQSVCRIDGVDFYLGRHGSPESFARYAVLIREYQANGLSLPEGFTPEILRDSIEGFSKPATKIQLADSPVTISHVLESYKLHIRKVYAANPVEIERLDRLCEEIKKYDGKKLASDYGPRSLQSQRDRWVASGKARVYCNRLTNATVRIFKYAVSQEFIKSSVWQSLKSVEPLRNGQTEAHETVNGGIMGTHVFIMGTHVFVVYLPA
jgi:hypothetical protein